MAAENPPAGFESGNLVLASVPAGEIWQRIYFSTYTDPLGFNFRPSRFSDPEASQAARPRFAVAYFGSSLKVCFLEAVLRNRLNGRVGDYPIAKTELRSRVRAIIEVTKVLNVVSLCDDGPARMGIPSDAVRASNHTLGQIWSAALWSHDYKPDGLLYPSRLNEERNLALYDRALGKVRATAVSPLIECGAEMADLIHDLELAIV